MLLINIIHKKFRFDSFSFTNLSSCATFLFPGFELILKLLKHSLFLRLEEKVSDQRKQNQVYGLDRSVREMKVLRKIYKEVNDLYGGLKTLPK